MAGRPGGAAEPSGGAPSVGRSSDQEDLLSERRQYRKFNAQQKTELVLAALKGQKSIPDRSRPGGSHARSVVYSATIMPS